jgi:hypothetical protein
MAAAEIPATPATAAPGIRATDVRRRQRDDRQQDQNDVGAQVDDPHGLRRGPEAPAGGRPAGGQGPDHGDVTTATAARLGIGAGMKGFKDSTNAE